jgi:hypothetical protein
MALKSSDLSHLHPHPSPAMSTSGHSAPELPSEIIAKIVDFASWPDLWRQESPVSWLKSISTLSRVWCDASQRMIFYSFTLGVSARSPPGEGKQQILYLEFLESRPDLGRYIRSLDVFSPVIPGEEMARRLPAAIPNVERVTIDVQGSRFKSAPLTTLITGLLSTKLLTLQYPSSPSSKGTAIRFYRRLHLSVFAISVTSAVAAPILEALADSSSATSLNRLELDLHDSDPTTVSKCRDAIEKLPNIQMLNLVMNKHFIGYGAFPYSGQSAILASANILHSQSRR